MFHIKKINSGGYGDLFTRFIQNQTENSLDLRFFDGRHTTFSFPDILGLAHKLLHHMSLRVKPKDVENEERAIKQFCSGQTHKNIVTVLRLRELGASSYYFVDTDYANLVLMTTYMIPVASRASCLRTPHLLSKN